MKNMMPHILFSQKETKYLVSQRLTRIATASISSLENRFYNLMLYLLALTLMVNFFVGGMNIQGSNKYKNFLRNNKVAIIIDDLGGVDPAGHRGIHSS
jgi:hypothetical protein